MNMRIKLDILTVDREKTENIFNLSHFFSNIPVFMDKETMAKRSNSPQPGLSKERDFESAQQMEVRIRKTILCLYT